MRTFLLIFAGAAGMYILLKAISKIPDKGGDISRYAKELMLSVQFRNLTRTNEFREMLKMPEMRKLLEALAEDQLKAFSQSIT
jgi:hypothetical protein